MIRKSLTVPSWTWCLLSAGCGVAADYLVALVLLDLILPLRRPVQVWLTNHGMGSLAVHYGMVNLHLPTALLSLIAGAVMGVLAPRSWARLVLFYAAGPIVLDMFWSWSLGGHILPMSPTLILYQLAAVVPIAFLAGWACSPRSIRRLHRREHNLCVKCGYDLRASKERCPECGSPFENRRSDNNCRYAAGSTK